MSQEQTIPSVRAEVRANKGECDRRHERTNEDVERLYKRGSKHNEIIIELVGRDGSGGRMGRLETETEANAASIKELHTMRLKALGALAVVTFSVTLIASSLGVYLITSIAGGGQ